jgi:hypothetical protein
MAVDHDKIARILGEEGATADTSLRAKSLQRASGASIPHTLTPFEWEQWYAEHGVPDSHRKDRACNATSWWRRLLGLKSTPLS